MQLDKIRTAIENAISVSVHEIQLPGIDGAHVQSVTGPSEQLQLLAAQLEQRGQGAHQGRRPAIHERRC